MSVPRNRSDRCPGVLRPWAAPDGMLVRLRLVGGQVSASSLRALAEVADEHGDGRIHVTSRANLQVRSLPGAEGRLRPDVVAALEGTGLLPTRTHELVRNVVVSPQTGRAGGLVDLRPVAADLDARLCADAMLGSLPGRFLFVLDDGRGDVLDRTCDLGLVALDASSAQLRVGTCWGDVVPLAGAAERLTRLATEFLARRGEGPRAAWHVAELPGPLVPPVDPDPRLPDRVDPLSFGEVPGGRHVAVPEAGLDQVAVDELARSAHHLVVTPWRGVLIPEETR